VPIFGLTKPIIKQAKAKRTRLNFKIGLKSNANTFDETVISASKVEEKTNSFIGVIKNAFADIFDSQFEENLK
jgi:hypothetical protein